GPQERVRQLEAEGGKLTADLGESTRQKQDREAEIKKLQGQVNALETEQRERSAEIKQLRQEGANQAKQLSENQKQLSEQAREITSLKTERDTLKTVEREVQAWGALHKAELDEAEKYVKEMLRYYEMFKGFFGAGRFLD